MKKIIVTGGSGRFGSILKKYKSKYTIYFPTRSRMDIKKYRSIDSYIKKIKPDYLIHCAAISRPMKVHDKNINQSINTNIIGTCNVVMACQKYNTKLVYFSTNYVYPKFKGTYRETDPVFPFNNYGWSKLGGEAAVQMYNNSLILRICMTEKPFVHKKAFKNVKTSFMYHDEVVPILFKILNKRGILNLGGKPKSIYDFAKKENKYVKKIFLRRGQKLGMPFNSTMNLSKLNSIIRKKN